MEATLELRHVRLGDRRLDRRLVRLVDDLTRRPEAAVPQACGDWAAAEAAYRFWDNPRVDPGDLVACQARGAVDRLPGEGPILAIQDTTALDFTGHPATEGLGYVTRAAGRGLLAHAVLLADDRGVPPGLVHQAVWARDPAHRGKRVLCDDKPTAEKETRRWLEALAATEAALPEGRALITVADREAHFYDLLAARRRAGSHLLIRALPRRRVRGGGLLGDAVRAAPVDRVIAVELPRADDRPARAATIALRHAALALRPPANRPDLAGRPDLPVAVILAEERGAPEGAEPICWYPVTTAAVADADDAERAVRRYARRWLIERFHYVLKSGCRVERLQLGSADRLRRAPATYALVAWRLLWLTYAARREPGGPCEPTLRREEWEVLHRMGGAPGPPPETAPSLREAVRQIARPGGFLARAGDGEPGVRTIWRGLRRMDDLVMGWQLAARASPEKDVGNG
jgi:hypothetical protein